MTAIPPSEAACLLATGKLYRSRVGLLNAAEDGHLVFAGFKKGAFSIYFGDAPIYHFDLEGRWQRAYIESTHYLKGLNTRVDAIDRVREGANLVLRRRTLGVEETQALDLQVRGIALGLLGELERGRLRRENPPEGKARPLPDAELGAFLEKIAAWDAEAWARHRTLYDATYGPLPFLPPECQNAVVIEVSPGHAARHLEDLSRHVDQVVRLLGRRLLQSRVVFLAGGDVLRRPADEVSRILEIIASRLPLASGPGSGGDDDTPQLAGIYTFVDEFSSPAPGPEALRAHRERHLVHVSLMVESGDPEIRGMRGRDWSDADLRRLVADLRSAGIDFSLLTLVGAGGPERSERHRTATAGLLASLDLARGATVFLLDEREFRDPETAAPDAAPWDAAAWQEQQAALKKALSPLKECGVKVLPYSLEKQWA